MESEEQHTKHVNTIFPVISSAINEITTGDRKNSQIESILKKEEVEAIVELLKPFMPEK